MEDRDLYDSKLDSVDEVLYFRDALIQLQQNSGEMYNFLINCLDNNEQNMLNQCIKRAEEYQQQMLLLEQNNLEGNIQQS